MTSPAPIDPNRCLPPEEMAPVLRVSVRYLLEHSGNGPGQIPVIRLGRSTFRYHPLTVFKSFEPAHLRQGGLR